MTLRPTYRPVSHPGVALLVAMIFLTLFACMAVALVSAADMNTTIARNRIESHQAGALAEGGLLLVEQCLSGLPVPGTHDPADIHEAVADHLRSFWADSPMLSTPHISWDEGGVDLPPITFDRPDGRQGTISLSVSANAGGADNPTLTVESTGRFGRGARTASIRMTVESQVSALFRYGIATKSHVKLSGNARIQGANNDAEGSIFSATTSHDRAVELFGNAVVSGDVAIANPAGEIHTTEQADIGGREVVGADSFDFPELDLSVFEPYATNTLVGGSQRDQTYTNLRIPAGANPTFAGNTILNGVVYIESPNKVTFSGNTTVCGVIVAEQPAIENLSANSIDFIGNLSASGVENLPASAEFDGLHSKTGSFLLAPGCGVVFTGNFNTLSGAIVTGQCTFSGNANGTVRGGLFNLSDSDLEVRGNAVLMIDKENIGLPASFSGGPGQLVCIRGSYAE